MDKICLIYQSLGIGDVFYCQAIAQHYVQKGYRVIWPISPTVMYLKDYIINPGVEFVSTEDNFPGKEFYKESNPLIIEDNFVFLPLANASHRVPNSTVMYAKYELLGLDFSSWRDGFNFTRNKAREDNLYYNVLGLSDDSSYVFLNRMYGTPPYSTRAPFTVDTEDRVVELQYLNNCVVFDWLKVIENASMVVTVDTSFQYLMEKIQPSLKSNHFYCYPRTGELNYAPTVDKLFNIDWKFFT